MSGRTGKQKLPKSMFVKKRLRCARCSSAEGPFLRVDGKFVCAACEKKGA